MGLDNPLHIAFLVVILLLIFGARRLPEIGRSLGSGMREFKSSITGEAQQGQPTLTAGQPQQPQQAPAPAQPVQAAQTVAAAQPVAAGAPMQAQDFAPARAPAPQAQPPVEAEVVEPGEAASTPEHPPAS